MKKFLTFLLIAASCLTVFAGCNSVTDPEPAESYVVEISKTTLTLDVYEMAEVAATVRDSDGKTCDKEVEWSSSQGTVVTVESGVLFAKSMGTATVTAQIAEGASATVAVTVVMNGNVPAIRIQASDSLSLAVGSNFNLEPRVFFKGADATDSDTVFTYQEGDKTVATVENGVITARKAGTTSITVTASWRGLGGESMVGSEDALGLRVTLNLTVKTVD